MSAFDCRARLRSCVRPPNSGGTGPAKSFSPRYSIVNSVRPPQLARDGACQAIGSEVESLQAGKAAELGRDRSRSGRSGRGIGSTDW